jgi:uncharacterized Ntn-hydrolase superfamily protein
MIGAPSVTYSISGYDPSNGDLGVAVQSKFPNVGGLVPYGQANLGVIATQAFGNPQHGSLGLKLLDSGASPSQTLDILLHNDEAREQRQVSVLDRHGRAASYTGREVHGWDGWAGDDQGDCCLAMGNGLASDKVTKSMVLAFEGEPGSLAERLIGALHAGQAAGGELRGQQSAALLVLRKNGGYGGLDDRLVTISIYDHKSPIDELARCFDIHRMSYFPSDPENLVPITGELAIELKTLLSTRGFYDGPVDRDWEQGAIDAMQRFMGWENYDNRIRDDRLIDTEVLTDMRSRHGQTT